MLLRTVIWLRWASALLALAILAALVGSNWYQLEATLPPTRSSVVVVSIDPGDVQFQWASTWSCDAGFKIERTQIPWGAMQHWICSRSAGGFVARAPLWAVALPPVTLAVAGFWLRRRQSGRGLCKGCGHPLMGAHRCPECGRAANVRAVSQVQEIASLCGVTVGTCGGFDLSTLGLDPNAVHASVVQYFCAAVPDVLVESEACSPTDVFRLLSAARVLEDHSTYPPWRRLLEAGFVSIATDPCGDSVVADTIEGDVYVVSHEIPWNDELSNDPGDSEANRSAVIDAAEWLSPNIEEFLQLWLVILRKTIAKKAKFLKAASRNPKATDRHGDSLLILLAREGDLPGVRREISRGAELEHFGSQQWTALDVAVVRGNLPIVKALLAAGANPNLANKEGTTSLMLAARYSKVDCIRSLLEAGAVLASKDDIGWTAYDYICIIHGTQEIADLLHYPGAKRRRLLSDESP